MSRNYSASQYEKTFVPKRLQMYEVPRDPQPGVVCLLISPTNRHLSSLLASESFDFTEYQ